MDLKKFEKELNKAGYFISTDQVVTARGDVVGQMDPYSTFLCDVDEVCAILSATPVKIKKPAKVLKRARTEDGHFKADDKSTPDVNEAWEV